MILRSLAAILAIACFVSNLRAADSWTQFRGPNGAGHSDSKGLPVEWSEEKNVAWKTPIPGKAWSSPVVLDGQIWVTNAPPDGKWASAVCLDLESGKILHDIKLWDIEKPQYCIEKNSYASCTPVIEPGRVYVHFGAHGTAAIDTASGKKIWERQDLPCNHHRGPASSPILYDDLLILTFDGFDQQYVVALNKNDGKTVWKKDRNIEYGSDNGDIKKAYCTPSLLEVAGKLQLVNPSAGAAIAYDPKSGDELWRVRCGGMNVSSPPLFGNGLIYMTTAAGGFNLYAVKPGGKGDITGSHVAWKSSKAVGKKSGPLLIGNRIFMSTDDGILSATDATDGTPLWQKRVGGEFSASPVFADGKIYFCGEDGVTHVVDPGKEGEEPQVLAQNKLGAGFMASPAVVGNSLLLRTKTHLYRIAKDK